MDYESAWKRTVAWGCICLVLAGINAWFVFGHPSPYGLINLLSVLAGLGALVMGIKTIIEGLLALREDS